LFLAVIFWISYNVVREKPTESLYGLITVAVGLLVYFMTNNKKAKTEVVEKPEEELEN